MFKNYKTFSFDFAGRPLLVETGKISQLSNGSCLVRYGDTVILANATASVAPREGIDFLPLSVDFEERLYSVGKIPGSFLKREGRPSEKAVLTSRVIDRPIRPLFPKDLHNDVCISLLVLSVDPDCSPEIAGMVGASIALSVSDIPWNGPIGGVFVGFVDGQFVVNPTAAQREVSTLELTVASTKEKVVMIEAGAKEVNNDDMFDAIMYAHEQIKPLITFIESIVKEIGKPKFSYQSCDVDGELYEAIKNFAIEDVRTALNTDDKTVRDKNMQVVFEKIHARFDEQFPELVSQIPECLYKLQKYVVRRWLLDEGKRVDGRKLDQLRSLDAEVGLLPRTHGSGLFTRGQTQVLTSVTLGSIGDRQLLDGIDDEEYKRYMHHYNMPGYSVGEAKASRSPGRREIGHGALAERALEPMIPSQEEFPYAIRLVSEVVSSNGSTSQGSICASTLALMDAGVPIKKPVAGISCGLITEGDRWMTMIDIQGLEDFFGDMDFKVAGTKDGITAIQMDLKIDGLTPEIIKQALETTCDARLYILDEVMLKAIAEPRPDVSPYAPKMISTKIHPDKIREVIGPGGKVIQKIVAETGAKIDIEDDGSVFIASVDREAGYKALELINAIALDPVVGTVYTGTVTRLMTFGAFVEFAPGKEGLVHISKLDKQRVAKVEDVVNVGDVIKVKIIEIDDKGRINLSRKDAMDE
ncbi:MAG TPA: polyribonucleotide nucleotidyltransferase [Clostridiales bacterium]|jgi:polyribonucleotide nucleotidyltransferase|nr:polyribonucleotide nucleotidyltransferase [Clostridiales bacterium]HCG35917.1 polyribonucleotide nucleotidyltransferase [Clostridiales bacterium]